MTKQFTLLESPEGIMTVPFSYLIVLKNILQSKWFTFAAVVVIGFFLLLIIKLKPSLETVTREIDNLNQKIAETEKNRSELERIKNYLGSLVYLEREARLKLNYKKPDESVVFVYKNPYAQNPAETGNTLEPSKVLPNWHKWLDYLFER